MVVKKETKTVELKDIKAEVQNKEAKSTDKKVETTTSTVETKVAKLDKLGRAYATGKRKDAVARVWIKAGKGKVVINGQKIEDYFKRDVLRMVLNQPFGITGSVNGFDVMATVTGGGLSGQAGAVKAGISKALCVFNPENRPALKAAGFLTRDSRVVERKKPGKKKARKSFQFSKR